MTAPGSPTPPGPPPEPVEMTCYRHADRRAGVTCQRCNRPICPSCMTAASVGFQCPECVKAGAAAAPVYTTATLPGYAPIVTYILIGLNVLAFIGELATAKNLNNVLLGTSGGTVFDEGVLFGPFVAQGEWWRLVTGGFLHAGLIHIGMNMFVLWRIGPQLERLLGHVRYLALYVAALFAGALGVMIVSPLQPTLGASGAIFGLLGAAAAYQLTHHIDIMKSGLGQLIMINVVITFVGSSFISVGGHIGGLIGGAAVGYAMFQLEERDQSPWLGVGLAAVLALVFAVVSVAVAPTVTFR